MCDIPLIYQVFLSLILVIFLFFKVYVFVSALHMGSSNSSIHDPEIRNMEAIKLNPSKVSIKIPVSMPVPQQHATNVKTFDFCKIYISIG